MTQPHADVTFHAVVLRAAVRVRRHRRDAVGGVGVVVVDGHVGVLVRWMVVVLVVVVAWFRGRVAAPRRGLQLWLVGVHGGTARVAESARFVLDDGGCGREDEDLRSEAWERLR